MVRPKRLKPGDRVGLVAPASANFRSVDIEIAQEVARAFSLEPRLGAHVRDARLPGRPRRGPRRGRQRFFADPDVSAIFAIRGGWGCARILPLLDWDAVRRNPKVVTGYSDVTGLHCGLQARTGLVTFHAPTLLSDLAGVLGRELPKDRVRRRGPDDGEPAGRRGAAGAAREPHPHTSPPDGPAAGCSAATSRCSRRCVGSPYVPALDGAILFLEDVNEEIYRVDRMLTQLRLAGLLGRVRGFVFGSCSKCEPGEGYGSLTLEEVLDEHVKPLGVPAYEGAMIGHQDQQFTVPVGIDVEMDATAGTIPMLEPAVL